MTDAQPRTAIASRARITGRVLAAFIALVVLALLLQPWWLAPLLSHRLSASAKREVHFDSMWIGLAGSFQPVVHIRAIRIENASWADRSRPFAALGEATAVFSWVSLRERRPVIALMTLRDGAVDLERRADGLRNWRLSNPEDRGPGIFKVLAVRGENATVRFLHERLDLDLEAKASARHDDAAGGAGAEPMPTALVVQGRWRGMPFAIDAVTAEVLTFAETGHSFRARGAVTAGGARLDFDGHLGDLFRDPIVDARVELAAPSLVPFVTVLGPRSRTAKAIAITGELKGGPGRYALAIAKGRLGTSDLAGELSWVRDEQRDLVRATLTSESTSLADIRSLAPGRAARVPAPADAAASAPASVDVGASAAARSRTFAAELSFSARRLHGEGMPWLGGARVEAALGGGRLTVSHVELGIGRGRVVGKGSVETESRPLHAAAELEASAIQIESLLPARASKGLLSGKLKGRATLRASGDSVEALLASASGTVSAFVDDGTISSLLDAKMGLQGGRVVRSILTGAEPMDLRCAAAVLDIEHGMAKVRSLVIDSERTRTTGTGTIDLAEQTFDLVLTPQAKQSGLFILDRSIHLHGPLREPRHELIARSELASLPTSACRAGRP